MKYKIVTTLIVFFIATDAFPKEITLALPKEGYPPFYITTNKEKPSGIVMDILYRAIKKSNLKLKIKYLPEKRSAAFLSRGKIDMRYESFKWVPDPENYDWSIALIHLADVLAYDKSRPVEFNRYQDLLGINVITHLGYGYPTLDEYFKKGDIIRYDKRNELEMLNAVIAKSRRPRVVVINKYVARWIIKNNPLLQNKIAFAKKEIDRAPYQLQFNKSKNWKSFIKILNLEIKTLKEEGQYQKIINRYLKGYR